jgi:hypothetical protein
MSIQTFFPYYEILSKEQKDILQDLYIIKELGFTLYGGTAVSLQLGHRQSVDFDFFSDIPFSENKNNIFIDDLQFLQHSEIIQKGKNALSYLTKSGVKLSFFGNINFGRVGSPKLTNDEILLVASLHDLLGTKLATILNRIEAKDYQDIAAILRSNTVTLAEGLGAAVALYGSRFPLSESVRTLSYFEGGNLGLLSSDDKKFLQHVTYNFHSKKIPFVPIIGTKLCTFKIREKS